MAKKSIIDEMADNIVKQLEEGTAPWVKPWDAPEALPFNPVSGTRYKGVNMMHLSSQAKGDPRWLTYKQAQSVDAQVRKGEKSTGIVFWKFHEQNTVRDANGKPVKDVHGQTVTTKGERLKRPIMLSSRVFNATQIDGLAPLLERDRDPMPRIERAESILKGSGASIDHNGGHRAFYRSSSDSIHLPKPETFANESLYYATGLHELGHWTGHPSRLDRDLSGRFGSEQYAKEELRAEIYSYMMSAELELPHDPSQHVAYIASWIKAIKEDPMTIHRACRDAHQILEYVKELVVEQQQEQQPVSPLKANTSMSDAKRVETAAVVSDEQERSIRDLIAEGQSLVPARSTGLDKIPETKRGLPLMKVDPENEFAEALKDMGLVLEGTPVMNGEMQRVPVLREGRHKPGSKDGAYVGHLDGRPAGYIKNHYTGESRNWKATGELNLEQRREIRLQAKDHLAERQAEQARAHERAAKHAELMISDLIPVNGRETYLEAKGVSPVGVGKEGTDILVIPIHDVNDKLWGYQTIGPLGEKRFAKGMKKRGNMHMLGSPKASDVILVCEGWATGKSLHEATGGPVAVAFDAGNLAAVARAVEEAYQHATVFVAGDDDLHKQVNTGRIKAEEAARAVGGWAIFPPSAKGSKQGIDFNDMAKSKGKAEVKAVVEMGIAKAKAREDRDKDQEQIRDRGAKV